MALFSTGNKITELMGKGKGEGHTDEGVGFPAGKV